MEMFSIFFHRKYQLTYFHQRADVPILSCFVRNQDADTLQEFATSNLALEIPFEDVVCNHWLLGYFSSVPSHSSPDVSSLDD